MAKSVEPPLLAQQSDQQWPAEKRLQEGGGKRRGGIGHPTQDDRDAAQAHTRQWVAGGQRPADIAEGIIQEGAPVPHEEGENQGQGGNYGRE